MKSRFVARCALITATCLSLAIAAAPSAHAGPLHMRFNPGGVACADGEAYQFGMAVSEERSIQRTTIGVRTGDDAAPTIVQYHLSLLPTSSTLVRIPVPQGEPYSLTYSQGSLGEGWGPQKTSYPAVSCGSAGATLAQKFVDVPAEMQFFAEITWLADQGVSTGWQTSDGSREYRPLESVNRDAMAAFMYRLAGSPEFTPPTTSPFTDVATGSQFYKEITWLSDQGISSGWKLDDGTREFRPVTPIARDAMAAFMYRFAGSPETPDIVTAPFTDVPAGSQFATEIAWMAATGISTGWSDGTYRPLEPVARDAMAAFMLRFAKLTAHVIAMPGDTYVDAMPIAHHPIWDSGTPLEGTYGESSTIHSYFRLDEATTPGTKLTVAVTGTNDWDRVEVILLSPDAQPLATTTVLAGEVDELIVPQGTVALRILRMNNSTWTITRS